MTATLVLLAMTAAAFAAEPCRVEVVDAANDWPVPMVELRTTGGLRFVTDNAGVVAVDEPDLMGREVWFHVDGTGYEVPQDGFGYRGVRLVPEPGRTLRVEVERTIVAKRLGRLTGAGLFAETRKFGTPAGQRAGDGGRTNGAPNGESASDGDPTSRGAFPPASGVVGCDSVQLAVHRGRSFWVWGDTTLHHYPLGIFHASAATTAVRPLQDFEPPIGIAYDYFRGDHGRPRDVAKLPGDGPTWLSGLVSLPDSKETPRLAATYAKITPPLEAYERGLCTWNEEAKRFERTKVVWTKSDDAPKSPPLPDGHAVPWTDANGRDWMLFGDPLPRLKCRATFEAWSDPAAWETLEPQKSLPSVDGGEVVPHSGSIAWHPWRERWVTVFMQKFGKPSAFGELWYAEADTPTGPWGPAVKVLSHANYTFYNPRLHPEWFAKDSPALLFEGTYTKTFADDPQPTPRYDYNQILYRLDLDDSALSGARGDTEGTP